MRKKKLALFLSALMVLQAGLPATAVEMDEGLLFGTGSEMVLEQETTDDTAVPEGNYDDQEQAETEGLQDEIILEETYLEDPAEELTEGTGNAPENETEEELFLEEELSSEAEATSGAEEEVPIDEKNFPDAAFRSYIKDNCDENKDNKLSPDEINTIDLINVSWNKTKIKDLTGIEHFTSLKTLMCEDNDLTSLDVSKNMALAVLDCPSNQLETLDVSKNTELKQLFCYNNRLTELDVSENVALTELACYSNQLTSLDVSGNTALTKLNCGYNQLETLDVSKNAELKQLFCYNCKGK